jgi:hypothetical protein
MWGVVYTACVAFLFLFFWALSAKLPGKENIIEPPDFAALVA